MNKPIPPTCYAVPGELTSPQFCRAFARGSGGTVSNAMRLKPGPLALFGSVKLWPLLQTAQAAQETWYYGDHGFFIRGIQYRVSRNAYQHSGDGDTDPSRWRRLNRRILPWRKTGAEILLCPQTPQYHALFGMDREQWCADIIATLAQYSDRPVVVRGKTDATPIEQALKTAWAVVSYSSAVAIDAMLMGVPSFTLAPWASAYRMGTDDLARIESPVYPDGREELCRVLANNQWTLNEITRGMAWESFRAE